MRKTDVRFGIIRTAKRTFWSTAVGWEATLWLLVIVATMGLPVAVAGEVEGKGPAFSDPSRTVVMGKDWEQKKIVYEDWAKGADLVVTLDQHLYPALLPMIRQFAAEKKKTIRVREGTCGISAGLLSKKHVDIGGFCCPPGENDRLPGLQYHTLGIAALGILVNSANPATNLSEDVLRQIFSGELMFWNEVPDKALAKSHYPIRIIGRLHCKQRPGHWRLILDNEDLFGMHLFEVGEINDMVRTIGTNPDAIGYEVLWNIERHDMQGRIKPLLINGGDPRNETDVVSLQYPFYRVYNITTWTKESGLENPLATELVRMFLSRMNEVDVAYEIIPATKLRAAGWKFQGTELVGEPSKSLH